MEKYLKILGAREHNLKDINLKIPKNKLIVFTGVSGSGKSSLAMDTLFVEGQRRYVESLSSYARQFLGMAKKPDIDTIVGLSPSIAIDQSAISHNPRSTVGTVTEVYDYFRLLFAKIGHLHCPLCGREITTQSPEKITKTIAELIGKISVPGRGARLMVLAPLVRDRKGEFRKLFTNLRVKGYQRVRIDNQVFNLDEDLILIKTNKHTIEVVVDRLQIDKKSEFKSRLKDSLRTALELSDGQVIISEVKDASFSFPEKPTKMVDHLFSQKYACPFCNLSLEKFEPRNFSFNSPHGACEECDGLGVKLRIDTSRVSPWRVERLQRRYRTTTSDAVRKSIEELMIIELCPQCQGARLKKESLSVTIMEKNIAEVSNLSFRNLLVWAKKLPKSLPKKEKEIAQSVLSEIFKRVNFLNSVGLEYLSLDRGTRTLAVGEAQRIRLASQIGSGLSGVLYILDEPTIGLHPRDTKKLIKTLKSLRNLGNTVIVIEHDREMIENADYIFDFGPGAGKNGGRIVAQGTPEEIKNNSKSLTGQYLKKKKEIEVKSESGLRREYNFLKITGCSEYNLANIDASFPLRQLICITGVSGAGKSTLVSETLYRALKRHFSSSYKEKAGEYKELLGTEHLNRVLLVDQSPIGKTPRSNPATYISAFDEIRRLFAQTKEAKIRGFSKSFFSFNVPGGRCEECQGQGEIKEQMQFLPDVYITCDTCAGKRYTQEVLEADYQEKNIADVLDLTIAEALEFFQYIPPIVKKLEALQKIGLDYLQLGQPSPTLSGGEAQRLKLARELVKASANHTLYLLDEPTVGLHFEDLKKLLIVLKQLVNKGNTIIIIEHNPDIIKNADWIIDLGPEGGEKGGRIVAQGKPEDILRNKTSYTGQVLKAILKP